MLDQLSPYYVLAAFNRIESELPKLVGNDDWQVIGDHIKLKLEQLRRSVTVSEQILLTTELVSEVTKYVQARERLNAELKIQAIIQQQLNEDIATFANELNVSTEQVKASVAVLPYIMAWAIQTEDLSKFTEEDKIRIALKPGGLGGGKSIKFSNLHLDLGQMSEIIGGALLAGYSVIDKPHPFIIVASALFTIAALVKAMTVQLSECEASVFWGFIQARDKDNIADEVEILKKTNTERRHYGLAPLKNMGLRNALKKLEAIKSIEQVKNKPRTWRIIEKYSIEK